MEMRHRVCSGVRLVDEGGRLRVLRRADVLDVPPALCTPLMGEVLEALSRPSSMAEVSRAVGADVAPLLPLLERLGVVERALPPAVPLSCDLPGLLARFEAEGVRASSDAPALVVWGGGGEVPTAGPTVLQYTPWTDGLAAIGPLGPCRRCWQARLAAHGAAREEGVEVLSEAERRRFIEAVAAEVTTLLLGRPHALRPGQWRALDHETGTLTTHAFMGLAGCPLCPGHPEGLVDPRSGLFSAVEVEPMESRRAPMFVAVSRLGDVRALGRGEAFLGGAGVAPTPALARGKAVGEGLERYGASLPAGFGPLRATWREVGRPALDPEGLALFSATQHAAPGFPYVRATRDLTLAWVEGVALPSGEPLLVPAACVYMPYDADEPPLLPAHSHGLGCGPTFEAAVRAGLLELVERDAFMRFWQRGEPAPRLGGLERLHGVARGLLDEAADRGWGLDLLLLPAEGAIPVVLAVARPSAGHGPRLVVGAAADPQPVRAVERAMLEVMQNYRWLAREVAGRTAPETVVSFEDHALYYSLRPDLLPRLEPLWRGRHVDLHEVAEAAGDPIARVAAAQVCAAVDLTPPDVAAAGFRVARVVVPALVRVHAEEHLAFLGSARLGGRTNPLPHPFP